MARSRIRTYARELAACEPGGCGAKAGEPCVAYRESHHWTALGHPVQEIHAARRDAFKRWLAARPATMDIA